jgi:hypothetical protein
MRLFLLKNPCRIHINSPVIASTVFGLGTVEFRAQKNAGLHSRVQFSRAITPLRVAG